MQEGFLKNPFELAGKKIWVAGHRGMVGSALCRRLASEKCKFILASRNELDLRRQESVETFLRFKKPDVIVIAAARVGGIHANSARPASFIYDNLAIETNIIHAAWKAGVKKLMFLGSSCIYPKDAPQPIREEYLLGGPLEPTNEWYAIAKIAGLKLCQAYRREHGADFITAMPCNLYGPGDNFNPDTSHVVPSIMQKAHDAAQTGQPLTIWGTGTPRREFMFVDDLADALVYLLKNYSHEKPVNTGSGQEVSIAELARQISEVTGYNGPIFFDRSKPDGVKRKIMDNSRLFATGWKPKTGLRAGLELTYQWYCDFQKIHRVAA